MYKFRIPKLGQSESDMQILEIMVKEGDRIKQEDPVVEIETEKASTVLESEVSGTVKEIFYKNDDYVKVGDILFTVEEDITGK